MTEPPRIQDMYDRLPPERGIPLRRRNKERLAELERQAHARHARLTLVTNPPKENA